MPAGNKRGMQTMKASGCKVFKPINIHAFHHNEFIDSRRWGAHNEPQLKDPMMLKSLRAIVPQGPACHHHLTQELTHYPCSTPTATYTSPIKTTQSSDGKEESGSETPAPPTPPNTNTNINNKKKK